MLNVCHRCGLYHADKIIDPSGPYAICPECGYKHPFRQLPLLIVSGASGTGKSTVCQYLIGQLDQVVLLDSDILWRPEFDTPENNYRQFFETWLRLAKNIAQAGRPAVIFGAGMGVPGNIEPCIERRYFSRVEYLALVCEDDVLVERLHARPAWRHSGDQASIGAQVRFNRWFKDQPTGLISLLDTTGVSPEITARQVAAWIRAKTPS
jgi:predicted kinase/DNA-directed RNA polymerase subunit RPC12/RpoP